MGFVVRRKVLDELLKDPEWGPKYSNATTTKEMAKVITDYCKSKGLGILSRDFKESRNLFKRRSENKK